MKKTIKILLIMAVLVFASLFISKVYAASTPVYDGTFNNNTGIFYANGTPITIDKDASNNTVVSWSGGSQIVPQTVTIVGGGNEGSSFDRSSITMKGGTVSVIYGGGISLDETKISKVKDSNVTIKGGTVLTTIYGGGLIYTTTNNSNVIINNGDVHDVCGGGCSSAVISGVSYMAGNETDLVNSKNRVINSNIKINGGTLNNVFGGGQGYSYVENANILMNDGDMSSGYLVAGGSNGYTKNTTVKIKGGKVNVFQTVNRGVIEEADVIISDGEINEAYVGGEPDSSVTGKINKVKFEVLGGKVHRLEAGTSETRTINIDNKKYELDIVKETVEDSSIKEKAHQMTYDFGITDGEIKLYKGETLKVDTKLITTPRGYEYLFKDFDIKFETEDGNIVTINSNGEISGINEGTTIIRASMIEGKDFAEVTVVSNFCRIIILIIVITLFIIAIILGIVAIAR